MARPGYAFMLRGLLYQLLSEMLRGLLHRQGSSTSQRKKIAAVLDAMTKEPNRSWTAKEMAQIGGYHPTYFAALFKEVVGYAPKRYLVLERIRLAKGLLLELDAIEAVAEQLNYSSVHYFSRHFKEVTGLTPSEFKKRQLFM